jgi:hypothetical protein
MLRIDKANKALIALEPKSPIQDFLKDYRAFAT